MTNPVFSITRQGRRYKRKGVGSALQYDGAYTSELFAFVNATTGAERSVVAAVAGSRIRVLSIALSMGAGGGTLVFNTKPAGAGTAISPTFNFAGNGGLSAACDVGLFETSVGEGLTVTSTTSTCGVMVTYILVD